MNEIKGQPVQILTVDQDKSIVLKTEVLESILCKEEIKNRNVVVVSVAGAFSRGKSFLLNFFLRYMETKYNLKSENGGNWIGSGNQSFKWVSWCHETEKDTMGIYMWSEVFQFTSDDGEKIAIVLLDTRGSFCNQNYVKDCTIIYALSTMLSSVQIYNVSQNISEDDLQNLQLFTDYGRLALEDVRYSKIPFQKLLFLVRDWSFPCVAQYGLEGGQKILDEKLKISNTLHPDLQSLKKHFISCFSDIRCYLMPHPGLKVATNSKFDGTFSDIETEFKQHISILVSMLLQPSRLILKKINGQKVKANDLVLYFKTYFKTLKYNHELPEPKSMLIATVEANNLSAVVSALEVYNKLMKNICGENKPYINNEALYEAHSNCEKKAIVQFITRKKMGGDELSAFYRSELENKLDIEFLKFKIDNENKNIFKSTRTPAVIFTILVACFLSSGFFKFFGLYSITSSINFFETLAFLILLLWSYGKYSGEFETASGVIDDAANKIWDNFMKPSYEIFLQKAIEPVDTNEE